MNGFSSLWERLFSWFRLVIDNAVNVGCRYFVIEQKTNLPYKSIEESYNYLINNKIIER